MEKAERNALVLTGPAPGPGLFNLTEGDGSGTRATGWQIIVGRRGSCAIDASRLQKGPIALEFRHDLTAMLGAL